MKNAPLEIRKILIPCDFSSQFNEVLRHGCDFARKYNAQITLLHVYEPPTYAIPPDAMILPTPDMLAQQISEIMGVLEELKKAAEESGVKVVNTKVAQGVPALEIIQEGAEGDYQLIVMGTHGRTGLKHVLIGSVAEKVVRKSGCAVMTVRTAG